jgi:hypothetical protein
MDSRLYFVLGDLLSNILVGALAGWLSALVIVTGWPMVPAMFLAMAVGMLVGLLLFFPLGMAFGAMEVMVPTMFSGMLSGMVVGMWDAMHPVSGGDALLAGAGCGLLGLIVVWLLNHAVRGRRVYPQES